MSIRSTIVYTSIILNVLLVIGSNTAKSRSSECVFCDYPKDKLVFENDTVMVFSDRTPKASTHYLICPKEHIVSIKTLTTNDIPMLIELKNVANQIVQERFKDQKYVLGFHVPPFYSIKHLHLHLLIEPFTPKLKRLSYSSYFGGLWFKEIDKVIKELQDQIV